MNPNKQMTAGTDTKSLPAPAAAAATVAAVPAASLDGVSPFDAPTGPGRPRYVKMRLLVFFARAT